ncbi:MAG: hypothetical protein IH788_06630, partial [Nitrospinae bacterium]|nr:hypothetical protein [Nitrospinota bacterium]
MKGIGRIANGSLVALAAVLALGLATAPAWAVTCTVPTTTYPKIQDAVDDAAVCDVVVVKKCVSPGTECGDNGVHHEAVDIDNAANVGLTFRCRSGVTLDGADPAGHSTDANDACVRLFPAAMRWGFALDAIT